MSKGDSIPTRFDPPEEEAIDSLQQRTGLSRAEIIRRAVRLLKKRFDKEGSAGFIVEELGPEYKAQPKTRVLTVRKGQTKYAEPRRKPRRRSKQAAR